MWKKFLTFITMTWVLSSSNAAQITCQFSVDQCNVVSITPVTRPNEVITVSGMPLNYVNYAVKLVILNGPTLAYVPNGICKVFPNLAGISMSSCRVTNFLKDSFFGCPNLVSIQIAGGNFPSVPAGFAQSNFKLNLFILMYANTLKFDRSALIGLTNLQHLIMNNNKISCVPFDLFQNARNLVSIDMSNNQITALDMKVFNNLPTLMTANFRNNFITSIPCFELSGTGMSPLVSTLTLDFDANQIRSVNPAICSIIATRYANHKMTDISFGGGPCTYDAYGVYRMDINVCNEKRLLQTCYSNWRPIAYVPMQC